jgi:arsenate reductase
VECPYLPSQRREDGGLSDPTGQSDEVFLSALRAIEEKVRALRADLLLWKDEND